MTESQPIALDAMGGDEAPDVVVAAAKLAVAELGITITLVGLPELETGGIPLVEASQVIAMHDDPAKSVRTKKDSSLVRAAELVRDGHASAMVSAGNTGATVASALLRMGRIKGVSRPCVATPIPVPNGMPTTLVDAGAMADCRPEWLETFARLGSVYATERFGIENPRVGLLSIGEEPSKGNELTKATYGLLQESPVNFVGNVEGRDIMSDKIDVVVCDGYTGNVVLKTLEGSLKAVVSAVFGYLSEMDDGGADAINRLVPLAEQMSPDTYGGAMLLGVNGLCIISHGSSSERALVNALKVGADMHEAGLVSKLAESLRS
ncbi:MAG: phosphate acyltransferase PlsX [Acidimicrobiales bacterium]